MQHGMYVKSAIKLILHIDVYSGSDTAGCFETAAPNHSYKFTEILRVAVMIPHNKLLVWCS
jgi:hypothetical protein